jgi:competence transcription factor ComK
MTPNAKFSFSCMQHMKPHVSLASFKGAIKEKKIVQIKFQNGFSL